MSLHEEPFVLIVRGRITEAPKKWRTNLTRDIGYRLAQCYNLSRGDRREALDELDILFEKQLQFIITLPKRVQEIVDANGFIHHEAVSETVLPKRNILSNTQREKVKKAIKSYVSRRNHLRGRKIFERIANLGKNNSLLWFGDDIPNLKKNIDPIHGLEDETGGFRFFGEYPIEGEIEVELGDDFIIFYFSNPQDYYRAYGNKCGTDMGKPSIGAVLEKRVVIIRGTKAETRSNVLIHEDQHIKNGYLFSETDESIETRIKDEIVAYLTDPELSVEQILAILLKENGLYHYSDISDWEEHKKMVERHLRTAFRVKEKRGDTFLLLLAVTEMKLWKRLCR
ncbi:MAG: hypothetical protein HHAS10_05230 [Candidatus Altimarinota bacterium]